MYPREGEPYDPNGYSREHIIQMDPYLSIKQDYLLEATCSKTKSITLIHMPRLQEFVH